MRLIILGEPKAQQRHRHYQRGRYNGTYDPSKRDKQDFLRLILRRAPREPFDEPLRIDIIFYLSRPKSHYGTGKNKKRLKPLVPFYHTRTPDIDNLQKFVFDAMNGIFWRDDSVICISFAQKLYGDMPRTEIEIRPIWGMTQC